ncbi:ectoine/hydroxyectoine ABC transporter substrate-binding protein EhuB [Pseudonocardiaceae bacterium YIM PH 21723]|nr:ectoine/hydroxyectoine ABC transporter substrate-binding protein EhuB [Pseudonocardiaceae bacterium YIM PH 21723]
MLAAGCTSVDISAQRNGGNLLDQLRDRDTVRMGIANEAPQGFIGPEGQLTGEGPEVGGAVFRRLGVSQVEPVLSDFGSLIPGLRAGLFDVIAAGMYVTPQRCAQILLSDPSYNAPEALLLRGADAIRLGSLDAFIADPSAKLGVLIGGVEQRIAKAKGIPDARVVAFDTQASGVDGVLAGRADGLMLSTVSLRMALAKRPGAGLQISKPFVPVLDNVPQYGAGAFGFRQDQTRLRDMFDTELRKLKRDGEWLRIAGPLGFTEDEYTELTTEELCSGRPR